MRIDDRVVEYIFPKRILQVNGDIKNPERLLEERELQVSLDETYLTEINGPASLLLDFGRELHGGIRLAVHLGAGVKVRMRLGESASEALAEHGYKNATSDHSNRDIQTVLQNFSTMDFFNSGFRFLFIEFLDCKNVMLKGVAAAYKYRDIPYLGDFCCDDERVNEIYKTARYTCHLNMQDMLWDGIKRDRLVWIGDMHPELLTIRCVFGEDRCIPEALDFSRAHSPLPGYMCSMPSYSMWYILLLKDYYMQSGSKLFLKENLEYLKGLVELFDSKVREDGEDTLESHFLDWPTEGHADKLAGVRGLFRTAAEAAAFILGELGEDKSTAERLYLKLTKKDFPVEKFKQAMAFKSLFGGGDRKTAAEFISKDGPKGFATFTAYYTLKALASGGQTQAAFDIMKEYFGAMLDRGATTFWEDFNMDWLEGSGRIDELPKDGEKDIHGDNGAHCYIGFRHSLCHGWASGAVPFLTEFVLGVKILEPGCKKVEISPNLCGLKRVSGKYPTPLGIIEISHEQKDDKVITNFAAPKGIEVVLK